MKRIVEKLQIPFDDSGKHLVANFGGGSSFDGLLYGVDAKSMNVLTRWKMFQEDREFCSLFKDLELIELSKQIFGMIEGTEAFIASLQ